LGQKKKITRVVASGQGALTIKRGKPIVKIFLYKRKKVGFPNKFPKGASYRPPAKEGETKKTKGREGLGGEAIPGKGGACP